MGSQPLETLHIAEECGCQNISSSVNKKTPQQLLVLIKLINKAEICSEFLGGRHYYQRGQHGQSDTCLPSVLPMVAPQYFSVGNPKTKAQRMLIVDRNIWGEELRSKCKHSLMEVETV